jgi:hypothetical protein
MATPSTIYFATGNKKKLEEVVAILEAGSKLPFAVEPAKLELPELQGEPEDISKEKCRIAAQQVRACFLCVGLRGCCLALAAAAAAAAAEQCALAAEEVESSALTALLCVLDGALPRALVPAAVGCRCDGRGYQPVLQRHEGASRWVVRRDARMAAQAWRNQRPATETHTQTLAHAACIHAPQAPTASGSWRSWATKA